MSLVTSLFTSLYNTQRQSDSEMGMSMTANRMMNRVQNAGNIGFGSKAMWKMHQQENNDMARLQMLRLQRLESQAMADSFGKMAREDAKRSFNVLA
jgi:hypothetical protein